MVIGGSGARFFGAERERVFARIKEYLQDSERVPRVCGIVYGIGSQGMSLEIGGCFRTSGWGRFQSNRGRRIRIVTGGGMRRVIPRRGRYRDSMGRPYLEVDVGSGVGVYQLGSRVGILSAVPAGLVFTSGFHQPLTWRANEWRRLRDSQWKRDVEWVLSRSIFK